MKILSNSPLMALSLAAVISLSGASHTAAQTFTTLHSFGTNSGSDFPYFFNKDGNSPQGSLTLFGNTLYGTTSSGGSSGSGTVFAINTDGTGFTNLHIFSAFGTATVSGIADIFTNDDGISPQGDLLLSGTNLYGVAIAGGKYGNGSVFAISTDGTGFTNMHTFTAGSGEQLANSDGSGPGGGLALSGNMLYGATYLGGKFGRGTVFAINSDGTGFTNVHDNTQYGGGDGLILSGDTLYGPGPYGGNSGDGTVFAIDTNGIGFTNLHTFTTASDPQGTFAVSGNMLYGTAATGGKNGTGAVFAVNTNGTGFTNLHSFTAISGPNFNNSDGSGPFGVIAAGNTLYGTTARGGIYGNGTVFAINTDGTGFTVLHTFLPGNGPSEEGQIPQGGLVLSGNTLYGTTLGGGTSGVGTIFSLSFSPQLTIGLSESNVVLTWPTNYAGFDYTGYKLESTTVLGSPGSWGAVSPGPTLVNGQNVSTNQITGAQQFFRLSQ